MMGRKRATTVGRVRREDVADAAGVSVYTVSLAMRGLPGVAAATRARVEEAADRLGYSVNPVAALLARRGRRGKAQLLRLACIGEFRGTLDPKAFEQQGVELLMRPADAYPTAAAASRRLWNEGVQGLVLSLNHWPWPDPVEAFDWPRFAAVKLRRTIPGLRLHLVRHSAFDYMNETVRRVLLAGHRRLAVLLAATGSEQDDDARWGAVLNWRERKLPAGASLRVREVPRAGFQHFDPETLAWLRAEPLDAVIAFHWAMWYAFTNAGWRIPGDLALAAVLASSRLPAGLPRISGCDFQEYALYDRGVALVLQQLAAGQRGFPPNPHEDVIEPVWIQGETI
jgi:DNA-binding LacI/PurR family transcriptional regulator